MSFGQSLIRRSRRFVAAALLIGTVSTGAYYLTAKEAPVEKREFGISDALPADCLMHVSFAGLASGERCKATAASAIWNEPQMQDFVKPLMGMAKEMVNEFGDNMAKETGLTVDEVAGLLKNGFQLSVVDIEMSDSGEPTGVNAILAVDLAGKKEAIQKLASMIERMLQDGLGAKPELVDIVGHQAWVVDLDGQKVTYTFADTMMFAATKPEALTGVLNRVKAKSAAGGLSENVEYVKVSRATAPQGNAMLSVYVDVAKIIARVTKQTSQSAQLTGMMDAMGISDLTAAGYALVQEGRGFTDRFFTGIRPGAKGIYGQMKHNEKPLGTLTIAPEKAWVYFASRSDWGKMITGIMDSVAEADPDTASEIADFEKGMEEQTGLSLRKDILPTLGQEIGFWISSSPFGGILPEIVIALELADPGKFQANIDRLGAKLGPDSGIRSFDFMGKKVGYVNTGIFMGGMSNGPVGPGLKPSWTIDGNFAMIALTPQTLKNNISSRKLQRPTISANRDMANGLAQLRTVNPKAGTDAVGYVDMATAMTMAVDTVGHIGQSVAFPESIPVDMTLFPTTDVFSRHLFGVVTGSTIMEGGMISEVYSPFGYIPTIILTVAPAAAFFVSMNRASSMEPMEIEPLPPEEEGSTPPASGDGDGDGDHK